MTDPKVLKIVNSTMARLMNEANNANFIPSQQNQLEALSRLVRDELTVLVTKLEAANAVRLLIVEWCSNSEGLTIKEVFEWREKLNAALGDLGGPDSSN